MKVIKIPQFDSTLDTHIELARLSKRCHLQTTKGVAVNEIEDQIDGLASQMWGLTKAERAEIKDSLEELQ
jgi:hypothetical protein